MLDQEVESRAESTGGIKDEAVVKQGRGHGGRVSGAAGGEVSRGHVSTAVREDGAANRRQGDLGGIADYHRGITQSHGLEAGLDIAGSGDGVELHLQDGDRKSVV